MRHSLDDIVREGPIKVRSNVRGELGEKKNSVRMHTFNVKLLSKLRVHTIFRYRLYYAPIIWVVLYISRASTSPDMVIERAHEFRFFNAVIFHQCRGHYLVGGDVLEDV